MDGFEVYKTYLSLKLHFSKDNYNFFTFNGKSRASFKSFENRKDKYFFKKLGTKYNQHELIEFFVSHFIKDGNLWIGNLSVNKSKTYSEWKSKLQSMSFIFENEMKLLLEDYEFDSVFKIQNGNHPILLKEHLSDRVSLESMVILNKLVKYFPYFEKNISEPVVWPEIKKKIIKYEPFLSIDTSKYRCILLNICNSSTTK